jgi:hypothetical protein
MNLLEFIEEYRQKYHIINRHARHSKKRLSENAGQPLFIRMIFRKHVPFCHLKDSSTATGWWSEG